MKKSTPLIRSWGIFTCRLVQYSSGSESNFSDILDSFFSHPLISKICRIEEIIATTVYRASKELQLILSIIFEIRFAESVRLSDYLCNRFLLQVKLFDLHVQERFQQLYSSLTVASQDILSPKVKETVLIQKSTASKSR